MTVTFDRAMIHAAAAILFAGLVFTATSAKAYECSADLLEQHRNQLHKQDVNSQKTQDNGKDIPEPENINLLKTVLRDYAYCGQYEADLKKIIDRADKYIAEHQNVERPAIVLDIDETSLSNWEEID